MKRYVRARASLRSTWLLRRPVAQETELRVGGVFALDEEEQEDEAGAVRYLLAAETQPVAPDRAPQDSSLWVMQTWWIDGLLIEDATADDWERHVAWRQMQQHAVSTLFDLDGSA